MNEDEIDRIAGKIATNVPCTSLQHNDTEKEITIEQIVRFFTSKDEDKKTQIVTGRVYQKNKKLKFLETFFKLIEEEIVKLETKNNKDLDNSFFNLNKKILSANIYNIKEIINLYGIDEDRLVTFLLGTVIQSIYDKED
tara:strand:- start:1670 stop:2086 length:417 start_codon:yes stop_codon:yes gene_type:complete